MFNRLSVLKEFGFDVSFHRRRDEKGNILNYGVTINIGLNGITSRVAGVGDTRLDAFNDAWPDALESVHELSIDPGAFKGLAEDMIVAQGKDSLPLVTQFLMSGYAPSKPFVYDGGKGGDGTASQEAINGMIRRAKEKKSPNEYLKEVCDNMDAPVAKQSRLERIVNEAIDEVIAKDWADAKTGYGNSTFEIEPPLSFNAETGRRHRMNIARLGLPEVDYEGIVDEVLGGLKEQMAWVKEATDASAAAIERLEAAFTSQSYHFERRVLDVMRKAKKTRAA